MTRGHHRSLFLFTVISSQILCCCVGTPRKASVSQFAVMWYKLTDTLVKNKGCFDSSLSISVAAGGYDSLYYGVMVFQYRV